MIGAHTAVGAERDHLVSALGESDDDDDVRLVSDSDDDDAEGEYAEFGRVSRESFLGPLIRALIWRPHIIVLSFLVRMILLLIVAWPLILLGIIALVITSFMSMYGPAAVVTIAQSYSVAIIPLNIAITSVNAAGLFAPVLATVTNDLYVAISSPIRDLLESACPVVFKRDPDTIPDVTDTQVSCPALHNFGVFMFGFYDDLVVMVDAAKDAYKQAYDFIRQDFCAEEGDENGVGVDCSNICGTPDCLDPVRVIVAIVEPLIWAIFLPARIFAQIVAWIFSTFAIATGGFSNIAEQAAHFPEAFDRLWYEIRKWIINAALAPVDALHCHVVKRPASCIISGICGTLFNSVKVPIKATCGIITDYLRNQKIGEIRPLWWVKNPCSDITLNFSAICSNLKKIAGSCGDCTKLCHPFFGQGSSSCSVFKVPCLLGRDESGVPFPCSDISIMRSWGLPGVYPV